jgi:uncharacterized repeat protein (TIGR01451 family)
VAAGLYKPGTLATDSFAPKPDVQLYGGFAGNESQRSARNPKLNLSILSGDIDGDDTNTDGNAIAETSADIVGSNSDHVLWLDASVQAYGAGTVIDGFVITAGQANGAWPRNYGGGLYCADLVTFSNPCDPTLAQLVFSGNLASAYGGAAYLRRASPSFQKVQFRGNHADMDGGAVYTGDGNPSFAEVSFSANSSNDKGDALHTVNGNPSFVNVSFSGNSAGSKGGAFYNHSDAMLPDSSSGNPSLVNVSFSGNSAGSEGGAFYNRRMGMGLGSGNPSLINVILWGNTAPSGAQLHNTYGAPTLDHSLVEGGCPSGATCTDLVTGDPLLSAMGDHGGSTDTLLPGAGSAAIDAGTCSGAPATDQRGVARPLGSACDIGAVEVGELALVVDVSGLGAVSAAATPLPVSGGIAACTSSGGTTCQAVYAAGVSVSLDATPDTGQHWQAWGGDCSGASATTTVTMDAAKTCSVTFAISQFTVSFDSHGGSATAAITQDYASAVTVPAGPSRAGYHFVQWNTAADGSGTAYAPGGNFPMPAYDQTLHAIWSNSAPSLAVIDDIVLNEDGTLSTLLSVGDAESPPEALTVTASSALAAILPNPSIAADIDPPKRQMTLTPVADAFGGPIVVTVTVTDEGGLSTSRAFQVQVRPVNDAPSFTTTGNRSEAAGASGLRTVAGFIDTILVGPANEAEQFILGYSVLQVADPNNVVSSINVAVDGSLAYQLTGHGGTAQFEIRATDSGGTANGGQPTSAPVAFEITAANGADLQISKSNGVSIVAPGASVVYDIYVANAGPNAALGARVQDSVPAELEGAIWTCTPILNASCAATSGTGSIDEQVDLPAGGVLRYSLLATAVQTTVDLDLINTATVTAPDGLTELDATNNSDTDADRILIDGLFQDGFEEAINRITVPFTDRGD